MIPAGVVAGQLIALAGHAPSELVDDGEFADAAGWPGRNASFSAAGVTIDGPPVGGGKAGSVSRDLIAGLVAGSPYRLSIDRAGAIDIVFSDRSGQQQVDVPDGTGVYVVDLVAAGAWTTIGLLNMVEGTSVTIAAISLRSRG